MVMVWARLAIVISIHPIGQLPNRPKRRMHIRKPFEKGQTVETAALPNSSNNGCARPMVSTITLGQCMHGVFPAIYVCLNFVLCMHPSISSLSLLALSCVIPSDRQQHSCYWCPRLAPLPETT